MNFHTLTPELQEYVVVIFFMWCLGSSHLASHIYNRFFISKTIHPLFIQCIFKAIICLAAMLALPMNQFISAGIGWQLASIPIGLFLGWFVLEVELMINRYFQRQKMSNPQKISQDRYYYLRQGPANTVLSLAPHSNFRKKTNLKMLHEHYASHETNQTHFSLVIVLLIALFEEMIFRGYLITSCYLLPNSILNVALAATVLIFGISHASFGLRQMISKTILGACCMMAVLLCHTILPALLIHGYLNWAAFRCQDRTLT